MIAELPICESCHRIGITLENRWCGGQELLLCVDFRDCLKHLPKET